MLQSRSECVVFPRQVSVIISKDSKCISTQRNALGVCVCGRDRKGLQVDVVGPAMNTTADKQ